MWLLLVPPAFLAAFDDGPSDSEVVHKIVAGDRPSFRLLFDRYHLSLYRFLLRRGTPEVAAEDILQDVFAGLWHGRGRLDPEKSIRAYLYRACRNRLGNYYRVRARFTEEPAQELPSPAAAPDDAVHLALLRERLDEAVSQLPERRRAVFELCFVEGLTYKEAADVLGVSTKTIENQMGFAFKSIRASMGPYRGDQ